MLFRSGWFHPRTILLVYLLVAPLLAPLPAAHAEQRVSNCFKLIAGMGVSVVGIHEAGHTIAALALGYPMSKIHYNFSSVVI